MKPAFTATTLAAITHELQALIGGRIQRIAQPHPLQVVLSIYQSGLGEKHLLIDLSARFSRAHLITRRPTSQTETTAHTASEPPVFCRTARKYLGGGRIVRVSQRDSDRILDIRIRNGEESFLLSAELMGKHANLLLISSENQVLHAVKLITSRQSRVREVLPGQKYLPPPARPFPAAPPKLDERSIATSQELEEKYSRAQREDDFLSRKSTLQGQLNRTLKQKSFALQQIEKGIQESTRADEFQKFGELILAQLHAIPSRAQSVQLTDYYAEDTPLITVPLDETVSASENAKKYFERSRQLRERIDGLQQLQERTRADTNDLKALIEQLEQLEPSSHSAHNLQSLQSLRETAHARSWLRTATDPIQRRPQKSASKPAFDGYRIRRFTSSDSYEVLIGENASANDALVTRFSHSNDWWLHLRGGASSHAIIRTQNAPERVPRSTLLFAAELVVARSIAKHAGWAEVDYTLRKYVRKPRKSAPGTVVMSHQKTLVIQK